MFKDNGLGAQKALLLMLSAMLSSSLPAAEPGMESPLGQALTAWREGDSAAATASLSEIISGGSKDPRAYFYRGLIAEQQGQDGTSDFKKGAELEVASGTSRRVSAALEKVQGSLRSKIEAIREQARIANTTDPKAAANAALYRDAVVAMKAGNAAEAHQNFDAAINGGTDDPRVFYLKGVLLAQSGDLDNAKNLFRQGLMHETNAKESRLVSIALQNVQGSIRRIVEEEVTAGEGEQKLTRQSNQRALFQQEAEHQRQLDAEDDAQQRELLAAAENEKRAREKSAAQRILAEEQRRAEEEAKLNSVAASPVPAAPRPSVAVAEAAPAAEAPDSAGAPAVNPFLSGNQSSGSGTSQQGAPVDFSWLAPNTELVLYVRPADLTGSRFMAPLMGLPPVQENLKKMVEQAGFSVSDMESLTYGMGDVLAKIMGAALPAAGGGPPDPARMAQQFMNNTTAISVLRASKDIDFAAIARSQNAAEVSHAGKTFFLMGEANPQVPQTGVYPVDSRTFLFATEPAMKAALDRGPGKAENGQFAFVSSDSDFVLAFSNPALAPLSGSIPSPQNAPPFVAQLLDAVKGRVSGVAIALKASADLNLQVQLNLNDPSAGAGGLKALKEGVGMLQQMYPIMKAQVPEKLHSVTDSAVESASAQFSGSLLKFSITVPGELVTILQNSPELLGPMMAPGLGAPGSGGPPPGFENPSQGFGTPPAAAPGLPPEAPSAPPGAPQQNPSEGFGFGNSPKP